MTFILVPNQGEDLQINAWNWRATLELLYSGNLITDDEYERMGAQACGGKVDESKALAIAEFVVAKLRSMNPGERLLADLSVTQQPKKHTLFTPDMKAEDVDVNELYSATYEWLERFADFCRSSKGFKVS